MSVTFYIAKEVEDKPWRLEIAYNCDCLERFLKDWEEAEKRDQPFDPDPYKCDSCIDTSLNIGEFNIRDLLNWLDLPVTDDGFHGEIRATELAARCRRRLWDEARNHDPELPGSATKIIGGPTVINCGRSPDYLRGRTDDLLRLAIKAGERWVYWA